MNKSQELWLLVGSICLYNLSMFSWWAQPVIIHTLIDSSGFSSFTAGSAVSIELLAIAVTAFLISPWLKVISIRKLSYIAGTLVIVCHFVSASTDSFHILIASRFFLGCAEGATLAIANAVLASTKLPDRSYAILNIWNVISGVSILFIISLFEQEYGQLAVFGILGLSSLLMLPFVLHIPVKINPVLQARVPDKNKFSSVYILMAMLVWGSTAAMQWAFYFLIGEQTTLETNIIGIITAFAATGGVIGGFIAAYVSGKYGRYKILSIGLMVQVIIVMTLTHFFHNWIFMVTGLMANACVYFILPLFLGIAAAYDPTGRLPAATAGMFLLSGGTGTLLGGYLVELGGVQTIGWAVVVSSLFAWWCCHQLRKIVQDFN